MDDKIKFLYNGNEHEFPLVQGSENEEVESIEEANIVENDSKKDLATVREEISVEESKFAIRIPSSPLHDAHISQAAVLLYTQ